MENSKPEKNIRLDSFLQAAGFYENKELRRLILEQVFENKSSSSSDPAKELCNLISAIKVDGFRKGKAPENKIINEACKIQFWKHQKLFLDVLFDCWEEINSERINQASELINSLEADIKEGISESLKSGVKPENLPPLVNNFMSCHQCSSGEPVEVFFCAAILLKEEQKPVLPGFWLDVIKKLADFKPNAVEWTSLDEFVKIAQEMRIAKEKEQAPDFQLIEKAIDQFWKDCKKGIEYLGKTEVAERWDAFSCAPEHIDEVAEQIYLLIDGLKEIIKPLPSLYSSFEEEEQIAEKRRNLRSTIFQRFAEIDDRLKKPDADIIEESKLDEPIASPSTETKDLGDDAETVAKKQEFDEQEGLENLKVDGSADIKVISENEEGLSEAEIDIVEEAAEEEFAETEIKQKDVFEKETGPIDEKILESDDLKDHVEAIDADIEHVEHSTAEATKEKDEGKNWSAAMSCFDIASKIEPLKDEKYFHGLSDLLWVELRSEEYSSAYWIAKNLETVNHNKKRFVPSWIVEFIALASHLKHNLGPIAPELVKLAGNFNEEIFVGDSDWKTGIRLLIAGAMLKPSLVAPESGAAALLNSIRFKGDQKHIYMLCNAAVEFGKLNQPINPLKLGTLYDQNYCKEQLEKVIYETTDWFNKASKTPLLYHPAFKVWIELQKSDGVISQIITPICKNDTSEKEIVRKLLQKYSDEQVLKTIINETDKKLRGGRKSDKIITGKGLNQIISRAREAFEFARQWLALADRLDNSNPDWLTSKIDELKNVFSINREEAMEELITLKTNNSNSFCITSGACVLENAINQVHTLFYEETLLESGEETPVSLILNRDLLLLSSIRLNDEWSPIDSPPAKIASDIIQLQADGSPDWEKFFYRYCENGDHEKTKQILDYHKIINSDFFDIEALKEKREKSIKQKVSELNDEIALTRKLIGEAVAQNLLTEDEYSEFINQTVVEPDKVLFFPYMIKQQKDVRQKLNEKRNKKINGIKKKLKHSNFDESQIVKINKLIDAGDLGTAEEFMFFAESGENLPEGKSEKEDFFRAFFPRFVSEFERYMSSNEKAKNIINNIDRGRSFGPVNLNIVRGAELKTSREPIATWLNSKQTKKINISELVKILSWLGLDINEVQEVADARTKDQQLFKVTTKTISEMCPIPTYGTGANKNYRVLCVYGRPSEELIIEQTADIWKDGACIVLYFGRMTEKQMRNLAWTARQIPPGAIHIDESVLFYLLGTRGAKLRTAFHITIPFTSFNPYKPFATGNVPPEMFYGRTYEKKSIIDPHGSCFIYGGRQLRKSALLRSVEREFHRPVSKRYAFYVDLNQEGLGGSRPIDDVWEILYNNAKILEIVEWQFNKRRGRDDLIQSLVEWSTADKQRRLLILLDEADNLLNEDAKDNFSKITFIKKIMDQTERRVKFVFAGLHNVQRFARIPNQPLAHLGAPLCIGPLLNDGESKEAANLIEIPLSAMGYRFEPYHIINRILTYTNYQPSLIQLFCDSLVRHLSNTNQVNFDQKKTPPFIITDKHVTAVYQNRTLEKNIRDRFELTLNLDPRYMVIAYVVANEALNDEMSHNHGFSLPWILREVNEWWPKGFEDSNTIDALRGLLDEMIGLGVLARKDNNLYCLRSSNVLRLLGSQKEIEHTLLSAENWEMPKEFHNSIFRRSKRSGEIFRSPLTGTQESDLLYREHGIRLIFGSKALGINKVREYLEFAKPDIPSGYVRTLRFDINDIKDFKEEISNILISEKKEGLNLIFVPKEIPFSEKWVEEAANKLNTLKSQSKLCRVFFIFDPNALFNWLKTPMENRPEGKMKNVAVTPLKRWSSSTLDLWLKDHNLPPNQPGQRQEVMEKTGGWPELLYRFAELSSKHHMSWDEALDDISRNLSTNKKSGFLNDVGLPENTAQHKFMQTWARFEGALSIEEMEGLFDEFDQEIIEHILHYGEMLSICRQVDDNKWQQEKLVASLLR